MLTFIIKLVLANLAGDFLIQPGKWVRGKRERKHRSPYLYYHIGIHALALLLVLQFDFSYWLGILLILLSHLGIDILKLQLEGRFNERFLFFADQALHYGVIALVVYIYYPFRIHLEWIYSYEVLLTAAFLILVTSAASIVMRVLISRWNPAELLQEGSLDRAGSYIGMLERLFVFGFVALNYWAGIGFLLAAKSIFRFGDLSRAQDRKLTEYVLIGTLLSFGMAILAGLIYGELLKTGG